MPRPVNTERSQHAAQAAAGAPPEWFTANRVHGHTRLHLRHWRDRPEFTDAAAGFKSLGAHAFVRHVKTGEEDPWWPTGVQPIPPNVVATFINDAHAQGLRIIAYYWHMSEKHEEDLHPDWVCRRPSGKAIDAATRGHWLDITGPYREVVLGRLRELAAMGADGLLFDFRHLPPRGCWQTALAAAWQDRTGAPPPQPDDCDPLYQQFLDFKAEQIEQTFIYWRDQLKAEFPDLVFIVSTTTIPALTDREMTTRLVGLADSAKNEYHLAVSPRLSKNVFADSQDDTPCEPATVLRRPPGHVRQALGWTVLRDAADGRPPHIWARGVPDPAHAKAFAASLLTFGCIANMDVHEYHLSETTEGEVIPEGKTPKDALKEAFALGSTVSPHFAGTRPLRWAAIHFPERSRNRRGGEFRKAWREVLWPLVGAYQVLTEEGLPVGIVTDDQLERGELDEYRLLVLPRADELSHGQRRAVAAFTTQGGATVANDPGWRWSDPEAGDTAAAAFHAAIRGHRKAAPVRVTGGPSGRYGIAYRSPERLVVAVTNDFSWVQIRWQPDDINPAPAPATGVRVTWRKGLLPGPTRIERLRAIEAVNGTALPIEESGGRYRVTLPPFQFMALLVVDREV